MTSLEDQLLAAHAAGDKATLARLYAKAADAAPSDAERGFFLTQAYVFALDAGDPIATRLKQDLVRLGREVED